MANAQTDIEQVKIGNLTGVNVTWSLKNCISVARTSKLALALSWFCRRSIACTKNSHEAIVGKELTRK